MNDLVKISDGELMTNSKVVFEHFNVSGGHRYIMKRIAELVESEPEFGALNFFRSSYTSPQNKVLQCFNMTRDGFSLVAMSLNGKKALEWKIKFIKAFNEMEKGLLNVDAEMTRLSNQGKEIKKLGSEWGSFGHMINKQKKTHDKAVNALVDKVQLKLGLDNE
jgi:Rha family phage regulatory protein